MACCASDGCINAYKSHRWGRIKAQEEGWFFERINKKAWCPVHLPDWVKAWRIRDHGKHMPKSSPFKCRTCGRSDDRLCIVGKIGSVIWQRQIPLHRWHSTRLADYKKLNAPKPKET